MLVRMTTDGQPPIIFLELTKQETELLHVVIGAGKSRLPMSEMPIIDQIDKKVTAMKLEHEMLSLLLPEQLGGVV